MSCARGGEEEEEEEGGELEAGGDEDDDDRDRAGRRAAKKGKVPAVAGKVGRGLFVEPIALVARKAGETILRTVREMF